MSTNDPSITAVFAAAQKPARDLLAALKVGGNDMTPDFSALDTTAKQSFALAVEGKHEFTVANEVRVIFAVDEDGEFHILGSHPLCDGLHSCLENTDAATTFEGYADRPGVYAFYGKYVSEKHYCHDYACYEYEDGMEGTVEPLLLPERFAELLGRERAEYTPPCVDCDKAPCDCHDNDHPGYAAWEAAE